MTTETYAGVTGVLNEAVGNGNATLLLERIVHWCTRKKGGVMYQGRLWSYRTQAEWIKLAGLKERTGKTMFKLLAEHGFILKEMRLGGPLGNRKMMMHVALSDKTLALLGETHLQSVALKAELAIKDHAKTAQKEKPWAETYAEIHATNDRVQNLHPVLNVAQVQVSATGAGVKVTPLFYTQVGKTCTSRVQNLHQSSAEFAPSRCRICTPI